MKSHANNIKSSDEAAVLRYAYEEWYFRHYPFKERDEQIAKIMEFDTKLQLTRPEEGWLTTAREMLFLSTTEIAKRMKVSRSAYSRLEKNELDDTITLGKLKAAASAMDCELVYYVRPKSRRRFSELIWQHFQTELKRVKVKSELARRQASSLAAKAKELMSDSAFRKQNNWSRRKNIT